ncbi:PP2C family serine/threonine-protein phosphatase [Pseudoruegeria sp. HB172150]|uniref:PP2C family protein-serine/threonine phosphatase n=1 Tax=Pseudoruegeria sp. HB172150 TaxID=2721164 RepID=UPI001552C8DC|nr:protein phosphatase 2C domain-containing protein [Pseudoruegeria sp. HB172150]
MLSGPRLSFDVASALNQGRRENQEDAIVADFPIGAGVGLVVLADGMGGHQAGEVASKIVVTEVFSELKLRSTELANHPELVTEALRNAAMAANDCVRHHTTKHPATEGMGSTLIALVQMDDALWWISVGDSVLYLIRDGKLRQLNEDHSLAPQIDYMVKQGMMTEEAGRNHPDRNCLTSALLGEEISQIDCPEKPLKLRPGDTIVAASDGLPFLKRKDILRILSEDSHAESSELANRLVRALKALNHPDQDNVCLSVIRVTPKAGSEIPMRPEAAAPPPEPTPETAEKFKRRDSGKLFGRLRSLSTGLLR